MLISLEVYRVHPISRAIMQSVHVVATWHYKLFCLKSLGKKAIALKRNPPCRLRNTCLLAVMMQSIRYGMQMMQHLVARLKTFGHGGTN